jgi:hypothetical protein
MSCIGCEEEAKEKEAKGDFHFKQYVAATDLSEPWCEACRNCEDERAETVCWTIKVADLENMDVCMHAEAQDMISVILLVCEECNTVAVPMRDGRMVRSEDTKLSDLDLEAVAEQHYLPMCDGKRKPVVVLLSKGESKYGARAITTSPALPRSPSFVVKAERGSERCLR